MKKHVALLVLAALAGLVGCSSKEEVLAYYQANLEAIKAQKPLVELEAQPGQEITGLKALRVYAPQASGGRVAQHEDPGWKVLGQGVGAAAAVGGAWVALDGANKLAGTVGAVAGHNTSAPTYAPSGQGGVIVNSPNAIQTPSTVTPAPVVVPPVIQGGE